MRSIIIKLLRSIVFLSIFSTTGPILGQEDTLKSDWGKRPAVLLDTSEYISYEYPGAINYNIMIAASKGYSTEIKRLIQQGADINAATYEGATPLIFAVSNNQIGSVRTLLTYNPILDKVTSNYETPLLIAVKNNNFEIAEALIREGADIDFPDRHGATPLHLASLYGYLNFVDMLLYYDASADEKADDGTTPLLASIWAGNTDIADLLLQNGADPSESDNDGYTPFLMASMYGDTLIMNQLYKKGVDIYATNKAYHNALTLSILNNQKEASELLLKLGNRWTTSGNDVVNPYSVASKYRRKEVIKLLRKNNVPGQLKYGIDQASITVSGRSSLKDFYSGFSFSFKEPFLNAGIIAGCDMKLWYTRVMIKSSENVYYQYFDKGAMAYAGLFKDFELTDFTDRFNYSFSTSFLAAYTFGNKLKGSLIAPDNKFKIIPSAALKMTKMNLSFNIALEYLRTEYYHNGSLWFRVGCSYNYFFDNVRMKPKVIKW
jgi:ankyrin repeat protein